RVRRRLRRRRRVQQRPAAAGGHPRPRDRCHGRADRGRPGRPAMTRPAVGAAPAERAAVHRDRGPVGISQLDGVPRDGGTPILPRPPVGAPSWPVTVMFLGYPLWWALGLGVL